MIFRLSPRSLAPTLVCLLFSGTSGLGVQPVRGQELDFQPIREAKLIEMPIGVTRSGQALTAFFSSDDLNVRLPKHRILLVAGLDGSTHTAETAINIVHRFYTHDEFKPLREFITLSAVPCGNPDGLAAKLRDSNGVGGNPARGYPPAGEAYHSPTDPEAQYLWRWIGMHAPDTVIELVPGTENAPVPADKLNPDRLTAQLPRVPACGVGVINALAWSVPPETHTPFAQVASSLIAQVTAGKTEFIGQVSAARRELQRREARTAVDVAKQLAQVYGHELPTVAYIPGVACIARLRLARMHQDPTALADVLKLTQVYLDGTKPSLTEKSGGSELAGHLLWSALFEMTQDRRTIDLTLAAANRAFDAEGKPLEAMPTHSEMSDAVFMGCPILADAARLTGESKYWDMCLKHMRFMLKLNRRADGLHRHSPLDETAWGRGNGFPALGLAWSLDVTPVEASGRDEMLNAFQAHMRALKPHQDMTGMWHQVIDHPESFRELTSTCMITYAMIRGIRRGWLDRATYEPIVKQAWNAVKIRVGFDGQVVDSCISTGKMKSLREYLDRTAILGRDPRGGAMALLLATEMADWESQPKP